MHELTISLIEGVTMDMVNGQSRPKHRDVVVFVDGGDLTGVVSHVHQWGNLPRQLKESVT